MSMNAIGYAALCIIVPAAWGLVIYWTTTAIEKRVLPSKGGVKGKDGQETLPIDYNI